MSDLSNWVSRECNFCGVRHYSPTEEELNKVICCKCKMALGPLPGYNEMLNSDGKPYWVEDFVPIPNGGKTFVLQSATIPVYSPTTPYQFT